MARIATVTVKAEGERGWKIINASDFDARKHAIVDDGPEPDDRAAMEARAKALGVKFNARTSDAILARRISEMADGTDS